MRLEGLVLLALDVAALRHQTSCHDVVFHVHFEFTFFGDHELQKVEHIAGIQRRGVSRDQRRQIGLAHQSDAVFDHCFARFCEQSIAAHTISRFARRNVHNDRAWLHAFDHVFRDQHRCGTAGNERCRNDHIGHGHAFGHFYFLAL